MSGDGGGLLPGSALLCREHGTWEWLSLFVQPFLLLFFSFFLLENLNCSINGSEGGHVDVLSFRQLLL